MRFSQEDSKEIKAYLERRHDIKKIAVKVNNNDKLSEIEEIAVKNYLSNISNLLKIKGLDEAIAKDLRTLLSVLKPYANSTESDDDKYADTNEKEKHTINLSKDKSVKEKKQSDLSETIKKELLENVKTEGVSPIRYYLMNNIHRFIIVLVFTIILTLIPSMMEFMQEMYTENIMKVLSVTTVLIEIVLNVTISSEGIVISLDLAYITLPMFREFEFIRKYVSNSAQLAVMQEFM